MRLDNAYVRFTVYDPNMEHEYPLDMTTLEEEDLLGFKKCKKTIKEYLEDHIKTFPDVPDNANITIVSVTVALTIHNPPTPDMEQVTIEIDDYDQDEGCMVVDKKKALIFNLSKEYDDMTWRDMNRIVDRIIKIKPRKEKKMKKYEEVSKKFYESRNVAAFLRIEDIASQAREVVRDDATAYLYKHVAIQAEKWRVENNPSESVSEDWIYTYSVDLADLCTKNPKDMLTMFLWLEDTSYDLDDVRSFIYENAEEIVKAYNELFDD